jgi:hypothetical protein
MMNELVAVLYFISSIDLGAQFGNNFTVHPDSAGKDQFVGFAPGTDTRVGNKFVQSDFFRIPFF